ncbi:SRPBCC family protein [Solitalea sp. MAHUQ-68]|uniref:SRPBCC family protein n=1 Tax=Solitalea agri TaxID=2953739 RepID=A0A9X2JEJ6_9SPHI|nr:SRPBCC family protein [Solitalea agri]MCO4294789.1 SRPBCC family protein [Solitalea agri]
MKVLKNLLVGLVSIIILLVIISFFLASEYTVSRTTVIKAPVEKVYSEFNDLNHWLTWNSFDDDFPDIKYTTTDPGNGVGAKQSWVSEKMNGSMTITESVPNKHVKILLQFEGFDDPLQANIDMEPVAEGTKVTWTDEGKLGKNPVYKYMGLMMDKMMGGNMEKSFENIKKQCE